MNDFCIETERLRLRKFTLGDVKFFFDITRDEDIKKYLQYSYYETVEEVEKAFKKYYLKGDCKHDFYLVIEEKNLKQIIGTLVVTQNIFGEFNVNRMIAKEFRRKGYSLEALRGFINYLPKGSNLIFSIEEDNENSLMSIQKLSGIEDISDNNSYIYFHPTKTFRYKV